MLIDWSSNCLIKTSVVCLHMLLIVHFANQLSDQKNMYKWCLSIQAKHWQWSHNVFNNLFTSEYPLQVEHTRPASIVLKSSSVPHNESIFSIMPCRSNILDLRGQLCIIRCLYFLYMIQLGLLISHRSSVFNLRGFLCTDLTIKSLNYIKVNNLFHVSLTDTVRPASLSAHFV